MIPCMKPDTTMQELWRSKEARALRCGGDVRALCRELMEKQERPPTTMPLVRDLPASQAAHGTRITLLPPPLSGEVLLPDDPVIAELREIRATLARQRAADAPVLREDSAEYGKGLD